MQRWNVRFINRETTRVTRWCIVSAPDRTRAVLDAQAMFKVPDNWAPVTAELIDEDEEQYV